MDDKKFCIAICAQDAPCRHVFPDYLDMPKFGKTKSCLKCGHTVPMHSDPKDSVSRLEQRDPLVLDCGKPEVQRDLLYWILPDGTKELPDEKKGWQLVVDDPVPADKYVFMFDKTKAILGAPEILRDATTRDWLLQASRRQYLISSEQREELMDIKLHPTYRQALWTDYLAARQASKAGQVFFEQLLGASHRWEASKVTTAFVFTHLMVLCQTKMRRSKTWAEYKKRDVYTLEKLWNKIASDKEYGWVFSPKQGKDVESNVRYMLRIYNTGRNDFNEETYDEACHDLKKKLQASHTDNPFARDKANPSYSLRLERKGDSAISWIEPPAEWIKEWTMEKKVRKAEINDLMESLGETAQVKRAPTPPPVREAKEPNKETEDAMAEIIKAQKEKAVKQAKAGAISKANTKLVAQQRGKR